MNRHYGVYRVCAWLMCLIALSGCASNATVKCDGRLQPINAPAAVSRNHEESNAETAGVTAQEMER